MIMQMKMKKNIFINFIPVAVAAMMAFPASGQNLDPTVVVSRTYEGKLMEVHKPQLKMAVPDSVLRFDLEFDYSVSDSPYKGAYEFSPYSLDMKPSPAYRDIRTFYMKAGAGYQLHPVFDAVWSPFVKGPFRMNVYASNRSFIGNYWTMAEPSSLGSAGAVELDRMTKADGSKRHWPGYDLRSNAGVQGRYDWVNAFAGFDVAYVGLHQQDNLFHVTGRAYDAVDARMNMASKNHPGTAVRWYADLSYRFAEDKMRSTAEGNRYLMENDFSVSGGVSYVFLNGDRIGVGLGFDMAMLDGAEYSGGGDADVVPHYVMDRDRWHFDLGFRVSAAFRSEKFSQMYGYEEQMIYPDVRVEYKAIPDAMKIFLHFGGDSRVNSYADVLAYNRRADVSYGRGVWNLLDITDEKISVVAGLEGRIGPRFSYTLQGGYINYGNALLDGVVMKNATSVTSARWLPAIGYASYDKLFASAEWMLALEHFRFDGNVNYSYCDFSSIEAGSGLLLPAALTGDVALRYDWKHRVLVGADCRFSSARKGSALYSSDIYTTYASGSDGYKSFEARVPGYADLGLEVEYVVNRKFSAWARGGNLLGMTIQDCLLYAEKGPYFTLGICLNL